MCSPGWARIAQGASGRVLGARWCAEPMARLLVARWVGGLAEQGARAPVGWLAWVALANWWITGTGVATRVSACCKRRAGVWAGGSGVTRGLRLRLADRGSTGERIGARTRPGPGLHTAHSSPGSCHSGAGCSSGACWLVRSALGMPSSTAHGRGSVSYLVSTMPFWWGIVGGAGAGTMGADELAK